MYFICFRDCVVPPRNPLSFLIALLVSLLMGVYTSILEVLNLKVMPVEWWLHKCICLSSVSPNSTTCPPTPQPPPPGLQKLNAHSCPVGPPRGSSVLSAGINHTTPSAQESHPATGPRQVVVVVVEGPKGQKHTNTKPHVEEGSLCVFYCLGLFFPFSLFPSLLCVFM